MSSTLFNSLIHKLPMKWLEPPWLAHDGLRVGLEPSLPGPLLHKCAEEREKAFGFGLHEPAVMTARDECNEDVTQES